jgi:hypothetical protein
METVTVIDADTGDGAKSRCGGALRRATSASSVCAGGVILGVAQEVSAAFDPSWDTLAGHIVFLVVLLFGRWTHSKDF